MFREPVSFAQSGFDTFRSCWPLLFVAAVVFFIAPVEALAQEKVDEIQLEANKPLEYSVTLKQQGAELKGSVKIYPFKSESSKPEPSGMGLYFLYNPSRLRIEVSNGKEYKPWSPQKKAFFRNVLQVRFSMGVDAISQVPTKLVYNAGNAPNTKTESTIEFRIPTKLEIPKPKADDKSASNIPPSAKALESYELHFSAAPESLQFEINPGEKAPWKTLRFKIDGFEKETLPPDAIVEAKVSSAALLFRTKENPNPTDKIKLSFSKDLTSLDLEVTLPEKAPKQSTAKIRIDFSLTGAPQKHFEPASHGVQVVWKTREAPPQDPFILDFTIAAVVFAFLAVFIALWKYSQWQTVDQKKGKVSLTDHKKHSSEYSTEEKLQQAYGNTTYSGDGGPNESNIESGGAKEKNPVHGETHERKGERSVGYFNPFEMISLFFRRFNRKETAARWGRSAEAEAPRKPEHFENKPSGQLGTDSGAQPVLVPKERSETEINIAPALLEFPSHKHTTESIEINGHSHVALRYKFIGSEGLKIKDESINSSIKPYTLYDLLRSAPGSFSKKLLISTDQGLKASTNLVFSFYELGRTNSLKEITVKIVQTKPTLVTTPPQSSRDDANETYSEQDFKRLQDENETLIRDLKQRSKYFEETIGKLEKRNEQDREGFRRASQEAEAEKEKLKQELKELNDRLHAMEIDRKKTQGSVLQEAVASEEIRQPAASPMQHEGSSVSEGHTEAESITSVEAQASEPDAKSIVLEPPSAIDLQLAKVIKALDTLKNTSAIRDPKVEEVVAHTLAKYRELRSPSVKSPTEAIDATIDNPVLKQRWSDMQSKAPMPATTFPSAKERKEIHDNLVTKEILFIIHALDLPKNPEMSPALKALVDACGLTVVPAGKNRRFDGEFHQSLGRVEGPQDLIVEVSKRGFSYKGKLLNRAEVTIGRG